MDTPIETLTIEQIRNFNKVLEIFGDPQIEEEVPPVVATLEAARSWYLHRLVRIKKEGGRFSG
jgi:hypothetical protein